MKTPIDTRLWIDRLGARMIEPRDRYVMNEDQVMTSVEYAGPMQAELREFRVALDAYFAYCRDCLRAGAGATPLPPIPDDLKSYLLLHEAGKSAAKAPAKANKRVKEVSDGPKGE